MDSTLQWEFIDTHASLLYKTGRIAEAEHQAQRALDSARAGDALEHADHTRELLGKIRGGKAKS